MTNQWVDKGQWHLKRLIERLDVFGKLAVALALLAIWAWLFIVCPKQDAIAQQQALLAHADHPITNPVSTKQASLQAFAKQFPNIQDRAKQVERLMEIADMHDVKLDNVSYQNVHQAQDVFHHYYVEFRLNETYSNTYNFLSDAITKLPFASIERLNMDRDSINNEKIATKIKLGLHFTKNTAEESAFTNGEIELMP